MILKYKNNSGFTITELLVATAIFLVILLITIVNFRHGDQASELRLKGLQVTSDLRGLQNDALSARVTPNGIVPRAYGFHITIGSKYYELFAKIGGTNWLYDSGIDVEPIGSGNLGDDIIISGVNEPQDPLTGCTYIVQGEVDIVFTVPQGEIFIDGLQPDGTCGAALYPTEVELYNSDSSRSVFIYINWISGQISVSAVQ